MGKPVLSNSSGVAEALAVAPRSIELPPGTFTTVLTEHATSAVLSVSMNFEEPDTALLISVVPP